MDNKLLDLALRRRSIRRYGSEALAPEVIDEILKVGLAAPSSFGHNPVHFVVVQDPETIKMLGNCKARGGSQVNGADAVVVVMVETEDAGRAEFWIEDGAVASAYLLLAAEQFGAGACWVEIRNRFGFEGSSDKEIKLLLDIPDTYTVLNLIAIGTKGEDKPGRSEESLDYARIHKGAY